MLDHTIAFVDPDQAYPLGRRLRIGGAVRARWWDRPPFEHVLQAIVSFENVSFHSGEGDRRQRFEAVERFGGEVSVLGLVAARLGYVNDREGGLQDTTWGLGFGTDLRLDRLGRVGGRFDFASVPRAGDAVERIKHYSVSLWFGY
jgi:hypothetical protein